MMLNEGRLRMQGSEAHPRDYLNIFCLGKREPEVPGTPAPTKQPKPKSPQVQPLSHRGPTIRRPVKHWLCRNEQHLGTE